MEQQIIVPYRNDHTWIENYRISSRDYAKLSLYRYGTVRYQKNNDKKLFFDDFVFLDGHGKETHKIIQ